MLYTVLVQSPAGLFVSLLFSSRLQSITTQITNREVLQCVVFYLNYLGPCIRS